MKKLILILLLLCPLVAFGQGGEPTVQELQEQIDDLKKELEYSEKDIKHFNSKIETIESHYDADRALYFNHFNNILVGIGFIVTSLAAIMGIGVPLYMNRATERKIKAIQKTQKDAIDAAKEAKAYALLSRAESLDDEKIWRKFELFKEAKKLGDYPFVYNLGGNIYWYLKNYDKAIDNYTKAIKLNTNYADAYNNRGMSHSCKKEYIDAIDDYSKAIILNLNHIDAYHNRALAYDKQARKETDTAKIKEYKNNAIKDRKKTDELKARSKKL